MPEAAALRFGAEATEAAMRALRETCSRRLFHVFDETPAPRLRIKLFGPSRHVGIHNQALSQLPGPTQVEGNVARDPVWR